MVTGLFRDRDCAERAYGTLTGRGYGTDDVRLLMSEEARNRHFPKRRPRGPISASRRPKAPPWAASPMDGQVTKVDAKKGWVDVKTSEGSMKLPFRSYDTLSAPSTGPPWLTHTGVPPHGIWLLTAPFGCRDPAPTRGAREVNQMRDETAIRDKARAAHNGKLRPATKRGRPSNAKSKSTPENEGPVLCAICRKAIRKPVDLVFKACEVMHLSCYEGKFLRGSN